MTILITATILLILGLWINSKGDWGWVEAVGMILAFISGMALIIGLIGLPISRMDSFAKIAEYESVKLTLEQARKDDNQMENVALQHKIIDNNKWLASQLYYNRTLIDIWIPDEILKLKPIK